MLKDYRALVTHLKTKAETISKWPEIEFNEQDRLRISELDSTGIDFVNKHSIQFNVARNHTIIPSQYVLYAIYIKEAALYIRDHLDLFDSVKDNLTQEQLKSIFDRNELSISEVTCDDYSKLLLLKAVYDDSYSFRAKKIVNKRDTGEYFLRPTSDFYGSMILQIVNIPNVNSAIFGDFVYNLSSRKDIYSYLEKRFISCLPCSIVDDTATNKFAKNVMEFLYQYDKLANIIKFIEKNNDDKNSTIKDGDIRLTSIFRTSQGLLSDDELSSGGTLRFYKEPVFRLNDEFYYFSTQWTDGTESRLDLVSFNKLVNKYYPEFVVSKDTGNYILTTSKIDPHVLPSTPSNNLTSLPKPFLLLAGISGTGKTRYVREQSRTSADLHGIPQGDNYCLVPVRPDWHEPSDLLGYISRIGNGCARYIVTDLLRFIVAAWKHTVKSASAVGIDYKEFDSVCPFWLCLDEMNLAPVEQYFADYLSIIETRKWEDAYYSCDSFLKPAVINQQLDENGRADLWEKLEIAGDDPLHTGLREYFSAKGIPLPPNLIVAGTVNMDETTHGFSRKVIDRALTIDFGEFFPNDYDEYYETDRKYTVKPLSFPRLSWVHQESDLASVPADPDGRRTIVFLKSINEILDDTPFKLAYRALNEALLSVVCFQPSDDLQLQAVWDDFLMMKVLPRIEGDAEKLGYEGEETGLLFRLIQLLKQLLPASRPDLLRMAADGDSSPALCRSLKKLEWMQKRLAGNSFTAFWP